MYMRIDEPGKNRCIAEIVQLGVSWHFFWIDYRTNLLAFHEYGCWLGFARRHDPPREVSLHGQQFTPGPLS